MDPSTLLKFRPGFSLPVVSFLDRDSYLVVLAALWEKFRLSLNINAKDKEERKWIGRWELCTEFMVSPEVGSLFFSNPALFFCHKP